jgi:hypothetical protein
MGCFSKVVGYYHQKKEAYFEDARGPTTIKQRYIAVWFYLG